MPHEKADTGPVVPAYLELMAGQRRRIFAQLAGICLADLWARPAAHKWSIGEHLDHTRVLNRCFLRLLRLVWPVMAPYARLRRGRGFAQTIDDVYRRPDFPSRVGVLWPPRHRPERPVPLDTLRHGIEREHERIRGFFGAREERLLGQVHLYDPAIGWINLVQGLRVAAFHDEHHFRIVRGLR